MTIFRREFHQGCMLVVGGAKSGKSSFALDLCNGLRGTHIFLATAQPLDQEMYDRITCHQTDRGGDWQTVEEPLNVAERISALDTEETVILIDCVTLWLSNLFAEHGENQTLVEQAIDGLALQLQNIRGVVLVVSNEVGSGIVPDNPLARLFRDTAGTANQRIARIARKVVTVIAGLPLVLKDE